MSGRAGSVLDLEGRSNCDQHLETRTATADSSHAGGWMNGRLNVASGERHGDILEGPKQVAAAPRCEEVFNCWEIRTDSAMHVLWVKMGGLWPLNTGGRQRSFHMLSELARRHRRAGDDHGRRMIRRLEEAPRTASASFRCPTRCQSPEA
jgi:hypothetical protein